MLTLHEIILRLTFAAGMGAAIGVERDFHRRPAGIRTSLFVCLASALFTILSNEIITNSCCVVSDSYPSLSSCELIPSFPPQVVVILQVQVLTRGFVVFFSLA
jgi:hypothetical protein